jgi:hypothetical protein
MAIDRIGKGAGIPTTPETATSGTAPNAGAFSVERPQTATPTAATALHQTEGHGDTSPIERLRSGEVDVDGYVDLEVDRATASLQGLPPSALEDIKSILRDQMKTDPQLSDLVRAATGKMPTPPEDG